MKQKDTKTKIIGVIVTIITSYVFYYLFQYLFFPSYQEQLKNMANELNKTCPIMVDQYTRLDNALVLSKNVFQYNYTIVSNEKSEINLDTAKKYIEPSIINNAKTNPEMKVFRDHKTTLIYSYKDKNGVFVWKLSITPDMYE